MGPEQSSRPHRPPAWPDSPQQDRSRHGEQPPSTDDRYRAPADQSSQGGPADPQQAASWPGVPQSPPPWAGDPLGPLGVRPPAAGDGDRTVTLHDRPQDRPYDPPLGRPQVGPQDGPRDRPQDRPHDRPQGMDPRMSGPDPYLGPLGSGDHRAEGQPGPGSNGPGRTTHGRHSHGQSALGEPAHGRTAQDVRTPAPAGPAGSRPSHGDFPGPAGAPGPGVPSDLSNPRGPQGPQGLQDSRGPQGPHGTPGPRGPEGAPGASLGRDPADPHRPFVTAGQISGPKTPPPQRQQELWNTVFGENYQSIGDEDAIEQPGRPVWIFALIGSVVAALIAVGLWAFLAGPLAADDGGTSGGDAASAAAQSPTSTARVQPARRLPKYPGQASPVEGVLTDQAAAISIPRLGAPWRLDERPTVRRAYGFANRQYVRVGTDGAGKAQYAQLMSGALSPRLAEKYTSPENLTPVISTVAWHARNKFFPEGNTITKIAQQPLSINGLPGQVIAYEVTAGSAKTTMVVAAVSTGRDLPAIVYMSVPATKKELLPDVNTVFRQIRLSEALTTQG